MNNRIQQLITKYKDQYLEEHIEDMIMCGTPLTGLYYSAEDFSDLTKENLSFKEKTEIFFVLFKELLKRGHLKLQRDNQIIEHSPEEWEQMFRAAWPENDSPYESYEGDICIWFTDKPCPAYAVWVDPDDGHYYWST